MNKEKQIAKALLEAKKLYEASYVKTSEENIDTPYGEYAKNMEECLQEACVENEVSENMWALLNLAMHWWNDVELWCEDILAGRNVEEEMPCCNNPAKDKCKQIH